MLLAKVIVFFLMSELMCGTAEDWAPCDILLNLWKRRSSTSTSCDVLHMGLIFHTHVLQRRPSKLEETW